MGGSSSSRVEHVVYWNPPPVIQKTPQKIQLKNIDEIKKLFWTDSKYSEERQDKLSNLFKKYDSLYCNNAQNSNYQKNKITLIIFGKSQTGKSSFINHLLQAYMCPVSKYGSGRSCTTEAKCYGPTTIRTNQQILIIDTRGFDDYDPQVMDFETGQTLVQKIISDFMSEIQNFKPDSINFIITESLEGSTLQFKQNIQLILNLFGRNALSSTLIALTKYNQHRFQYDEMLKEQTEERIKSFNDQIILTCQEYSLQQIPYQLFHTHVYDPNTSQIKDQISNKDPLFLINQEQHLFSQINKLPSYPIQIINEYDQYCKARIQQLFNTEGIGYKTIYV